MRIRTAKFRGAWGDFRCLRICSQVKVNEVCRCTVSSICREQLPAAHWASGPFSTRQTVALGLWWNTHWAGSVGLIISAQQVFHVMLLETSRVALSFVFLLLFSISSHITEGRFWLVAVTLFVWLSVLPLMALIVMSWFHSEFFVDWKMHLLLLIYQFGHPINCNMSA